MSIYRSNSIRSTFNYHICCSFINSVFKLLLGLHMIIMTKHEQIRMSNVFNRCFACFLFQFQVCGITGRSYTYSRLRDHSAAFAIRLHSELNLQIGDVIAVCLSNIPEFPIAALGSIEAGLIVTTINPIYTSRKLKSKKFTFTTHTLWHRVKEKPTWMNKRIRKKTVWMEIQLDDFKQNKFNWLSHPSDDMLNVTKSPNFEWFSY